MNGLQPGQTLANKSRESGFCRAEAPSRGYFFQEQIKIFPLK